MKGFDVTSRGPDDSELSQLLAQSAYRAPLKDRSAASHLDQVLKTQAVIERVCEQAEHAANLPQARRALLLQLQAANAGYAAVLKLCVSTPSPERLDACELSRQTVAKLAAALA